MFEVIVPSASKRVETEAEADQLVADIQALFGDKITIQVNEITDLFDSKQKKVSSMTMRVKEFPEKVKPSP